MTIPTVCRRTLFLFASSVIAGVAASAAEPPVIPIWPGVPPGSEGKSGAETVRVTERGDHVVANVHRPTITVYLLFKKAGVPVEMHAYSDAGHGFGVRASNQNPSGQWIARFHDWLGVRGWL